jgi:hypothetical protein
MFHRQLFFKKKNVANYFAGRFLVSHKSGIIAEEHERHVARGQHGFPERLSAVKDGTRVAALARRCC